MIQTKFKLIFCLVIGALIGVVLTIELMPHFASDSMKNNDPSVKKPLYWVAPMDANYRRDAPGLSPMGMELVPVYDEAQGEAGSVSISPNVENNLGVRMGVAQLKIPSLKIKTVGYIRYDQDKLIHIHPRVSGWIEKLHVKSEGDPVKKGQPLYAIYSPELVNAQEEFLLALDRNNNRLVIAALSRLRSLQMPEAAIEILKKTRVVMQTVTIFSPQRGVVDNLNIREGFYVQPGTTMMSIGDLSEVWVEAEVFERQIGLVQKDNAVLMTLEYLPGKQWRGKVDYVYPTLDEKTRSAKLRLRFNNNDGLLKPNMFAQIEISTRHEQKRLLVPKESVIRTGTVDRVVVELSEGVFKSINVKVGNIFDNEIEILFGLKEHDRVVTSAQFLIDSESSKTSDFMRMGQVDEKVKSVWVAAKVIQVDREKKRLTLEHAAISEWQWPKMIMDFTISDDVSLDDFSPQKLLHVQMTRSRDNVLIITDTQNSASINRTQLLSEYPNATVSGVVNSFSKESLSVNISRGAIEKWQRPKATLDFAIEHSLLSSLPNQRLEEGQAISFTFVIKNGLFLIVDIQLKTANQSDDLS